MVEILAIGAHPDDCEIFMGGTLLFMKSNNLRVGICDLTKGEAGTYGNENVRKQEMKRSSEMIGIDERISLDIEDGNVRNTIENRLKVIDVIRKMRPEVVFSFQSGPVRHPDHGYCGDIVRESCFLSGLEKIKTGSQPFRPSSFIGFPEFFLTDRPDFVIDITPYFEKKKEVIRCYGSQVTGEGEDGSGSKTMLRSNRFWEILESRSVQAGALSGIRYGEPFYSSSPPRIGNIPEAFKRDIK